MKKDCLVLGRCPGLNRGENLFGGWRFSRRGKIGSEDYKKGGNEFHNRLRF